MKVGDKVYCINDAKRKGRIYRTLPNWITKGELYTIRFIGNGRLLLEEIYNPKWNSEYALEPIESGFEMDRFRATLGRTLVVRRIIRK